MTNVKGKHAVTANTESPHELLELPVLAGQTYQFEGTLIFDQLVSERTKLKGETPAQRRRRQKKAKRAVKKLFKGLEGSDHMNARLMDGSERESV